MYFPKGEERNNLQRNNKENNIHVYACKRGNIWSNNPSEHTFSMRKMHKTRLLSTRREEHSCKQMKKAYTVQKGNDEKQRR